MLKQDKDDKGSPIFGFVVLIEGVEGGKGQGYSKKEAQQVSSKETLQRLRREPQFIDAIFQAKSERTKMEEVLTAVAPDLEAEKTNFIIEQTEAPQTAEVMPEGAAGSTPRSAGSTPRSKGSSPRPAEPSPQPADDEFDLSDITANPAEPSREDIISAAEAAAYEA